MNNAGLPEIASLIASHFNLDEFNKLCFDLGINSENIAGTIINTKSQELVLYFKRRGNLSKLIDYCKKTRPNLNWNFEELHEKDLEKSIAIHKYSGIWEIHNKFSRWRGRELNDTDRVSFIGKAFLLISEDGCEGSGIQVGTLHVRIEEYNAIYEIVNEVLKATIIKSVESKKSKEILKMKVKVIRRQLVREKPNIEEDVQNRYSDLRADLEHGNFYLELEQEIGQEQNKLKGKHTYEFALEETQLADENYEYLGLFIAPDL